MVSFKTSKPYESIEILSQDPKILVETSRNAADPKRSLDVCEVKSSRAQCRMRRAAGGHFDAFGVKSHAKTMEKT